MSIAMRTISNIIIASSTPTNPSGTQRKSGNSSSVNSPALTIVVTVTEAS